MNRVQNAVRAAVAEIGLTLAGASSEIGRHSRYLHDYVTHPRPGELPLEVRRRLSRLTGVPEFAFRGAEPEALALPPVTGGHRIRVIGIP